MDIPIIPKAYYLNKSSLFSKGSIAMEDLKGKGEELDRFLDRHYSKMTTAERRRFIATLSGFVGNILWKNIVHRDLKGCNLFVLENGGYLLLDVEDIEFCDVSDEIVKDMFVQLNTTIPKYVRNSDRIRFFLKFKQFIKENYKKIFREIVEKSLEDDIIYEGISGLQRELWNTGSNRHNVQGKEHS
jgi:tRNA A-37 threonylcarbamoyl transferase component Bud32